MADNGGSERNGHARVATRDVVLAAVRLFTENGFEATTMDSVASASGVSRRSLFRRFGSKEDILFAEHDELFSTVLRYLEASPDGDPLDTVRGAARLVFQGHVGAPEITVPRYRLVRAHPRLRDREVAMTARYQSAFTHYLAGQDEGTDRSLTAGMVAASFIAAHNHVLRSWLRDPDCGAGQDPWLRFDEAMDYVRRCADLMLAPERTPPPVPSAQPTAAPSEASVVHSPERPSPGAPPEDRVLVAVYPSGTGRAELLHRIAAAVEGDG